MFGLMLRRTHRRIVQGLAADCAAMERMLRESMQRTTQARQEVESLRQELADLSLQTSRDFARAGRKQK